MQGGVGRAFDITGKKKSCLQPTCQKFFFALEYLSNKINREVQPTTATKHALQIIEPHLCC